MCEGWLTLLILWSIWGGVVALFTDLSDGRDNWLVIPIGLWLGPVVTGVLLFYAIQGLLDIYRRQGIRLLGRYFFVAYSVRTPANREEKLPDKIEHRARGLSFRRVWWRLYIGRDRTAP